MENSLNIFVFVLFHSCWCFFIMFVFFSSSVAPQMDSWRYNSTHVFAALTKNIDVRLSKEVVSVETSKQTGAVSVKDKDGNVEIFDKVTFWLFVCCLFVCLFVRLFCAFVRFSLFVCSHGLFSYFS
jgi:hypothetical protein